MKDNQREEQITIVGISFSDFVASDGKKVCGYKVWFLTPSRKYNKLGFEVQEKFLSRLNLDDLDNIKKKQFPYNTKAVYQIVSLNEIPKIIDIQL